MKQKALFLWPALLLCVWPAAAQVGTPGAFRSEFVSYDIRGEAEKEMETGVISASKYVKPLAFRKSGVVQHTTLDIPALWTERDVYLRDTGRSGVYELRVNGEPVALHSDGYSLSDTYITPYLQAGENKIQLFYPADSADGPKNLYIFSQPRIHIFDYTAVGRYDEEFRDIVLDLQVVVVNSYDMPEEVTVGYDLWQPDGKLKEYTFRQVTIPGRGCDTIKFVTKITGTGKFKYSAQTPNLYRLMLALEHDERKTEYIPLRAFFPADEKTKITAATIFEGDFPDPKKGAEQLKALKKQGKTAIYVARPQQKWFYDHTEQLGLWVIDRAAVEFDPMGGDRGPQGTAANKPELLQLFVDRQKSMFFRGRNRANIAAWSLGSPSGNGFNMYRSYLSLKQLDPVRPVIYPGAEGEWNNDDFPLAPSKSIPAKPTSANPTPAKSTPAK